MTIRGAMSLLAVCALLGAVVVVGATPALAEGDSVRARSASSFRAGGSPGGVSVEVRKRSDGCVLLRTRLGFQLDGVTPEQVRVQVAVGGQWWPVSVSGGSGAVTSARTSPAKPSLCKGKGITVKYRVAFLPGAPGGRLTVVGEATTAAGRTIGSDAVSSRVTGGRRVATPSSTPSPTPTKGESMTPTESPTRGDDASAFVAAGAGAGGQAAGEDDSGGTSLVMVFGVAMVAVGIALIVLLLRRSQADRELSAGRWPRSGVSGVPLPRNPGGTTYRAGGAHTASSAPAGGHPPPPASSGGDDSTRIMPRLPD